MKRTFLIILAVITGLYLLICLAIYVFQKHLIFVPTRSTEPPPGDLNIDEKYFTTSDGQILHGWWMPVDSSEYTLLFLHGNGGRLGHCCERMHFFRQLGCSTFAVDYRGYGKSSGAINKEEDIYEDGNTALKYLMDSLDIPLNKTIVWGWSLGGGVAAEICRNQQFRAVVFEGTFFSLEDIARKRFPVFPTKWFLKYHFMSGEKINEIKAPLFFIHSCDDKTIPFEQGMKLYDAAKGEKAFLEISGSHNHGYYDNREKVIHAFKNFLESISE